MGAPSECAGRIEDGRVCSRSGSDVARAGSLGPPLGLEVARSMSICGRGQGLAEYALILALITIVAISALLFLGGGLSSILSVIGASL
jgi:Flp pilus assembly pilin Flp